MIFAAFGADTTASAAAAAAAPSVTPAAAVPAAAQAPAAATITPPVMPSQATRDPFKRPVQASGRFVPRILDTGFIPEFDPFPTVMRRQMAQLPVGVHLPMRAEPGSGMPQADPSGQSSVPRGMPAPVAVKAGRALPPNLIMALGIMPSVRGVRAGRVNPAALVAAGRKPPAAG